MTVMQQRTFGVVWGFMPTMPIAPHESDERICTGCNEQTGLSDWIKSIECCEDCAPNDHTECEGCKKWIDDNDIIENNRGDEHCECCSDDVNVICYESGDYFHREDSTVAPDGERYGDDHFHDVWGTCDDCDDYTRRDELTRHYDSRLCSGCIEHAACETWDVEVDRIGSDDYDRIGSRRTFGVEMETDTCDGHEDWAVGHGWACCDDGSINGKEFVSPILSGNAGYDSAKDFIDRMDRMGCTVNDDCGFHLHIGVSDVSDDGIKSIALAYHYARNVFEGWVDESRRDTYYARRNVNSRHGHSDQWDADDIKESDGRPNSTTRYVWINWKAYDRFKTYEVRSHEPTCDGDAVCNWIKLHTGFADYFGKLSPRQVTRKLANMTDRQIVRELRVMLDETVIDYYVEKSLQSA